MADWLSPAEWAALQLSLRVAFWATVISLPFGILVALTLARAEFWGKQLLNGLVHMPLILPPVATGYLLLILFGRRGPVGSMLDDYFGIVLAFRWTGAVLAAAVMAFPLMVRAIRLAIEAVDPKLEQAAATLGANRISTFVFVTLPLILPGVIAGAIIAFQRRWANSARPSPSYRISPARRRHFPRPSTPSCRCPAAMPQPCASSPFHLSSPLAPCWCRKLFQPGWLGRSQTDEPRHRAQA